MGPPNESGPRGTTPEGTDTIITSTPAPTKKQEPVSKVFSYLPSNNTPPTSNNMGTIGPMKAQGWRAF